MRCLASVLEKTSDLDSKAEEDVFSDIQLLLTSEVAQTWKESLLVTTKLAEANVASLFRVLVSCRLEVEADSG